MSIGRVPGATGIQPSIVDAKGDIIAATAADSVSRLAVGTNNQVLMADSAQATGLKYANEATATLTAKGDILTATAANTISRLAVGSNNQVLTADSSTATGLKWAASSGAAYTAWTSYTPTWSQAGGSFSLGNGTSTGFYTRAGDLVYVQAKLVWGSTTSLNAAYLTGSLPSGLTSRQGASGVPWTGVMWYYDVSTGAEAIGTAVQHSSTAFRCYYYKADSTNLSYTNGFNGANPWTPATGDEIWLWGIYTTDAA